MTAPMFSTNAYRNDPYRTFKFRVVINEKTVAGLSKMTALKKTTEVATWRSGGDPSHEMKMPGGTKYEAITLEQGLTHDPIFEEWANRVNNIDGDEAMSLKNYKQNVNIEILNMQGKVAFRYKVFDAWVSEYQALPDFDANNTTTVGIQTIKLEHNGWVRDTATPEPTET